MPMLKPISDLCAVPNCTRRPTFELVDDDGKPLGKYCSPDSVKALRSNARTRVQAVADADREPRTIQR